MLYDLVNTKQGKQTTVMTDTLLKCKARMKVLKNSQRGMKSTYTIVPSDNIKKHKKKHHFRAH